MTETFERSNIDQELQLNNVHDANFRETLERLGKIPDPIVLEFKDGKGLSTVIKEQIIYPYYKNLELDDSAKTDYLLVKKIINKLVTYNIIKSADDVITNGETIKVKRKIIKEAVQEYIQEKNSQSSNGPETTKEGIPPVISYEVNGGDGYHKIIREAILKKYYPDLYQKCDKALLDMIQEVIEKDTGIKNKNLKKGDKLTIHTENIKKTIDNYLNGHETTQQQQTQPQTQPQQQTQTPEQGQSPEKMSGDILEYKVKKGDTIERIVKNKILKDEKLIYKYYPQLDIIDRKDTKLIEKLKKILRNKFGTNIKEGETLKIDMKQISQAIQKHLEIIERTGGLIPITSLQEFNESEEPIIIRLKSDSLFVSELKEKLKKGPVNIPRYLENRKTEKHNAEEITRPDAAMIEKRKNKLKGKTFVLDAGHGESDPGKIGIIKDKNGNQVVMFESAIALDMTYRTAQLLRACGAKVELTHYVPNRGICNEPDLPPCLGLPNEEGKSNGLFTDIMRREDINHLTEPKTFSGEVTYKGKDGKYHKKTMTYKRREETEVISQEQGNVDMFISLHMNRGVKHVMYETNGSDKFANHLKLKGFGDAKSSTGYAVLHPKCCPAVLIEMGNIEDQSDTNIFRDPKQRQKKAEDIVESMISYPRPK